MEAQSSYFVEIGGRLTNGFFKRNHFIKLDESFGNKLVNFGRQCEGKDMYVCAYMYESLDGKIPDIKTCRIIASPYLDFDGEIKNDKTFNELKSSLLVTIGAIDQELGIKSESMEIYFSGAKGFHVIIPHDILGLIPSENLNDDFKKFALYIKDKTNNSHIDTGIYDRRRLLRVSGTINSKTGLYKVPITSKMLFDINSYADMQKWASKSRVINYPKRSFNEEASIAWKKIISLTESAPKRKKVTLPDKKLPLMACSLKLLKEGVQKGARNNSAVVLASSLLQSGLDHEEALARLYEWNDRNDPPLSEMELNTTFRSAESMIDNGRMYGCSAYKELGFCVNDCPIKQREILGEKNHGTNNIYYA